MRANRRDFLLGMAGAVVVSRVWAAKAPIDVSVIRLIVPFSAGSATDTLARAVGKAVNEASGINVVVENRAGAAGMLAAQAVARAPADGATLFVGGTTTHAANQFLYKNLPYDPERDFSPICTLGKGWQAMVIHPSIPAKDLAEFIAYAKARPGELNFASGSSGSRIASEAFLQMTGLTMTHVPFKGNPLAITEVMAGRVQMMVADTGTTVPQIRAETVRVLGVTNAQRSPLLPDVPPIGDVVPGYDITNWFGLWGPAGMEAGLVQYLNKLFTDAAASATARTAFYEPSGTSTFATTPAQMLEFERKEAQRYGQIIRAAGIKPE